RDAAAIDAEMARQAEENARLFGPGAEAAPEGMDPARWAFIRRNRDADASADLARLDLPILAIWGAEDLNVDAIADAASYRSLLADNPAARVLVAPDATHGLLKAGPYNTQLTADWPWWVTARFLVEGRYAFAPGALSQVVDWIAVQATGSAD
ncbi:MAG: alpha/beta hydrolase, partial [Jannaschia sp.]